jgi:hypothetical protein
MIRSGKGMAIINNVILEPGRKASIPIPAGGQNREVDVKCMEVGRDFVLLEVQGYPHPLRITRLTAIQ